MHTKERSGFLTFAIRIVATHVITYLFFGLVMSNLLGYEELFQREIIRDIMLPIDTNVLLAIAMQPVRGLLFALALWPIWDVFINNKLGWLYLWGIYLVFGILSTTAAAPCSIEGILYTKLPLWYHLLGLPEIMLQTLTFSVLLVFWEQGKLFQPDSEQKGGKKGFFYWLFPAIVISCFAYIGYAIASVGIFLITADEIDFSSAAGDIKNHLMFVVAFLCNIIFVFFTAKLWIKGRITQWFIFGLAWLLDSLVLFLYQNLVFGSSNIMVVLIIGLLPALIIAFTIPGNYKKTQN